MYSNFDTLAALLEAQSWALLTVVDKDGALNTRPVKSLHAPFRGHIWLDAGSDRAMAEDIGAGTEVAVTFGDASHGPYVTVRGWAVLLHDAVAQAHDSAWSAPHPSAMAARLLLCVTASAAQLWETPASEDSRVFAFPAFHAYPSDEDAFPPAARKRWSSRPRLEQSI